MDTAKYDKYLSDRGEDFEAICKRCGECCGADDDPCIRLVKKEDGTYFCCSYKNRLGHQETVSGKIFKCISIRDHIAKGSLKPGCAYRGIIGNAT
ncbi:MAG: hypothetical protein WBD24_03985 [Candidatus Omnitrophota bacterium]